MNFEVITTIFSVIVLVFLMYGCWISSVILSERNKLRKITGAYYDFEITEALEEMGITREQALSGEYK